MNPAVRAIRDQIQNIDWGQPPEDVAAILVEAGFQLRDLADALMIDRLAAKQTEAA